MSRRVSRRLTAALASVAALAALPASADASRVTEFSTGLTAFNAPADISAGPDGNLWFTAQGLLPGVGKITPAGDITEYSTGLLNVPGDIVGGEDGGVWFTIAGTNESIARIDPANGNIVTHAIPSGSGATGLTVDDAGNLWYAAADKGELHEVAPDGTVTEHDLDLSGDETLKDVAFGPDGWVWFTIEHDGGVPIGRTASLHKVGRLNPADDDICFFSDGLTRAPNKIVAASDGKLYFTISGDPAAIGRVKMDGTINEYDVGTADSQPVGIAEGGDNALWFTGAASPGRIGRMTKSQAFTDFVGGTSGLGLLADAEPAGITRGPDGNIWFTERGLDGRIARITVPPAADLELVQAPDLIGRHDVTDGELKASVTPNTQDTSFSVKYGQGNAFDLETEPIDVPAAGGAEPVTETIPLPDLAPRKHYRAKVVATNASGEAISSKVDFWTDENGKLLDFQPTIEVPEVVDPAPTPGASGSQGNSEEHRQNGNTPAATGAAPVAPPVLGKAVVVKPIKGSVKVKTPGSRGFSHLAAGANLPVGTVVDTRGGRIMLQSARDANGRTQNGTFWGGVFQIRQKRSGKGMTDLVLRGGGFAGCKNRAGRASISVLARESKGKRRVVRRLWGKDKHSRFRTHGRDSVATVRGTKWVTTDRCDGTLTRVTEGAVMVRDLRMERKVLVRAGHSYLARHRHHR